MNVPAAGVAVPTGVTTGASKSETTIGYWSQPTWGPKYSTNELGIVSIAVAGAAISPRSALEFADSSTTVACHQRPSASTRAATTSVRYVCPATTASGIRHERPAPSPSNGIHAALGPGCVLVASQ